MKKQKSKTIIHSCVFCQKFKPIYQGNVCNKCKLAMSKGQTHWVRGPDGLHVEIPKYVYASDYFFKAHEPPAPRNVITWEQLERKSGPIPEPKPIAPPLVRVNPVITPVRYPKRTMPCRINAFMDRHGPMMLICFWLYVAFHKAL